MIEGSKNEGITEVQWLCNKCFHVASQTKPVQLRNFFFFPLDSQIPESSLLFAICAVA